MRRTGWSWVILAGIALSLAACQQTGSASSGMTLKTSSKPVDVIAYIAKAAQKCWFKTKDRAFGSLRLSSEINSHAGRPRILLVKKSDPRGLPQLVVQAQQAGDASTGHFTRIESFGPLLQTRNGIRINVDISRWSTGNTSCKA